MPMPWTRSGIRSRTEAQQRFGRSVRSDPFGASSPAQVYRASGNVQEELARFPAFPCTRGTEAPFVQAHRKGRCRLGPTPVLRRPTWAGKKDRTFPTEAAAISPVVAVPAWAGARHRDVACGDGPAGSLVGRVELGRVRPGPFPPVHVGRRGANAGSRRRHAIRWAVANGASIPFAQGVAEKKLKKRGHSRFPCDGWKTRMSPFLQLLFEAR